MNIAEFTALALSGLWFSFGLMVVAVASLYKPVKR
jgi:hypothetical protein